MSNRLLIIVCPNPAFSVSICPDRYAEIYAHAIEIVQRFTA